MKDREPSPMPAYWGPMAVSLLMAYVLGVALAIEGLKWVMVSIMDQPASIAKVAEPISAEERLRRIEEDLAAVRAVVVGGESR